MSTTPKMVHLQTSCLSLLLDCSSQRIPRVVYWGDTLAAEDDGLLDAIVQGSREPLDGNAPQSHMMTGIIPLESDGWPGRPSLSGHRANGSGWSPVFDLQAVEVDGEVSAQTQVLTVGRGTVNFRLVEEEGGLKLGVQCEILSAGLLRFQILVENTAKSEYFLQELGIALPGPWEANEALSKTGRWGKERQEKRRGLQVGVDLCEGRHGRTGADAPDFTFLGAEGFGNQQGEIWGLHVAFSGNHRTWIEKLNTGEQVLGGSEVLQPGEQILNPGANYKSPSFYALTADGLDAAANELHTWLRARPQHPATPRPVTLNVWEAVYFDHNLEKLKEIADLAASIGVERFVLDDGWFHGRKTDTSGLGDWYPDADKWPDGLLPLAQHVRGLGMQFGLWFEPEMVNTDSDLARAHPDWVMRARSTGNLEPSGLPLSWRNQQVLNLTIPRAFDSVRNQISTLVQGVGVEYIKWDHNRDLIEAGSAHTGGQAAVSAQTRAFYELVDAVKSDCPGLEIESCSSGGGRVDLEVMQHTDRVWVSDCIDPVERHGMVQGMMQMLPPELLGTHVASPISHTTGRWAPMSTRGGIALFGHFGIEWDILSASPDELSQLREWINLYKQERELLHGSRWVRCNTGDPTLHLQGFVASDKSRAIYQLFTQGRSAVSPRGRLRFNGLSDEKMYRVKPIFVGQAPGGLKSPPWFGVEDQVDSTNQQVFNIEREIPGTVLTGRALRLAGLQAPRLYPEQVLLLRFEEEDSDN